MWSGDLVLRDLDDARQRAQLAGRHEDYEALTDLINQVMELAWVPEPHPIPTRPCPSCNGTGLYVSRWIDSQEARPCPYCWGDAVIVDQHGACQNEYCFFCREWPWERYSLVQLTPTLE